MNSFFDNNHFRNNLSQSNRQEFMRIPTSNFASTINESSTEQLGFNQTLNYQTQFSNGYLPTNENLIGIFNQPESTKYTFKPNYNQNNQNFTEPNSFNNNNLSSYINSVSLYQNEPNNNENLIRFNFLQQFDSNLKQYTNYFPLNNQTIEQKPQQPSQHSQQLVPQGSNGPHISADFGTVESVIGEQKQKKPKKSRILFSQWQINELEKLFKKQKYVTSNERELMAKRLKLQANQVKIWFQNRRYKIKKQNESQKE